MKKTSYIGLLIIMILYTSALYTQTTEFINSSLAQVNKDIDEKNYSQALSSLNNLLATTPNNNNIYRIYADLLLKLNLYNNAISNIQTAILLSKENPKNYITAGNIYRAIKDFTNAQISYNKAIALNPNCGEAYIEYALMNIEQGYLQDSQRLAKLAAQYIPSSWRDIVLQAKIANKQNNFEEAQRIFLKGVKDFPYNEQLLDTFAEFYIDSKKYQKAIVILEEANKQFGESFLRNQRLASTLFTLKEYSKSLTYFEKLDQTYQNLSLKGSAHLKWQLYNLYKINNQLDKSYEYLKRALELDPENQLYITTLYSYLLSTTNSSAKKSLSDHIKTIASARQRQGVGYYFVSLLYKILNLNPADNESRKQLINYAKINQNQYLISKLLTEFPDKNSLTAKIISLRQYLTKTKQLDTTESPVYQYTNKIFIQDVSFQFGEAIKQDLKDLESVFPKIYSDIELNKKFSDESKIIFRDNTNYNIVTHIEIDENNSVINVTIFDKTGLPITTFKNLFTKEKLTENLINYSQYISQSLPNIGYINKRLPNSSFEISLGSLDNLTTNSLVTIVDKNFQILTTASITTLNQHNSIIKQLTTPSSNIDIGSAFIVPIEYTPSVNTNTKTTNTNLITNINQISQQHYSKTITLD